MNRKKKSPVINSQIARMFAANIAKARAREELTQSQLAARASCSPSCVCSIENYARVPSLKMIEALSHAMGFDPVSVIRGNFRPV